MSSQHITLVIATHKRVETLRCTLKSLILQQYQDWTALVIGDCCGDETAEMIRSLGESRIKYYNLTERFGEQSGPNSFGLQLAQGEFIAFLNHDDLLLRDHLDYSLGQMMTQGSDFHIGLCANATRVNIEENGTVIPEFTEILPKSRDLSNLILSNGVLFEPSSFWLIRTSYAKTIGAWKPSISLWRTPLRDWLMRAWRLRGKFSFGDKVIGLRFSTHNARKGGLVYANISHEHDYMIQCFQTESPEAIRQLVQHQVEEAREIDVLTQLKEQQEDWNDMRFLNINFEYYEAKILKYFYLRQILASCYFWLGIDHLNFRSRLLSRPKGSFHKKLLQHRTGENLAKMPNISELLQHPEAYRVL